jgi:hypothetical protein
MQCRKQFRLSIQFTFILILSLSALPNQTLAQDPSQAAGKDKSETVDASKPGDTADTMPATPLGASWSDSYIRQIGTSGLLAGNRQGIGWGSLYISSAGASGIVDRLESTGTAPGSSFKSAIFQTTLVYDHKLGNSRIALQYQPNVAISEGQIVKNFSNQNTSLDLLLYTRPRLNVRFGDSFRFNYTQQSVGYPYLDVNPGTAGSTTNRFIDGPSRWLSDSAYLAIAYALSPRSSIAVSPLFTYSESGVGANLFRGLTYGGDVNWNYRTSERQTVGLQYMGQLIREASPSNSSTAPLPTDTIFHTIAATTGRQLSARLAVSGSLGVTTSAFAQNQRQWFYYAALGVVEQLGRSSLGIHYSRGDTLSGGLISNEYADRVDIIYQKQMTNRLNWGVGGGYLRQIQSGGFSGWYATSNARFLLAPRAGLFATFDYFHKNQAGNAPNVFLGNRDIFSFGVLWQPGRALR